MNYEKSCESCVYRDKNNPDICKNCSFNETIKPRFELGKVDMWKLAEVSNKDKPNDKIIFEDDNLRVSMCPDCHETTLVYDKPTKQKKCYNSSCPSNSLSKYLTDKLLHSDQSTTSYQEGLSNPLLLAVKMFLADIRSWRRQYKEDEYVCADFAKEIYDAATERGIRCGYVVISFTGCDIRHAIVAFETDSGLKFFEPQSGDEEIVVVGRHYSTQLQGIPDDSVVSSIEIRWND